MAKEETEATVEATADAAAAAELEAASVDAQDFEQIKTRTPTLVGHVQLILSDGRQSDRAGAIVAGDTQDVGASGIAFVLDQDAEQFDKKRAQDARPYLSPASQQKLLEVLNDLRQNAGPVLLP
jgi:hypothetical protein